jgi:hypothetical protein
VNDIDDSCPIAAREAEARRRGQGGLSRSEARVLVIVLGIWLAGLLAVLAGLMVARGMS